ncbi:hypothetical protein CHARACLAT_018501 [Characodon lateralis]|uniref:Uncharacterized protein n=1 Tax=Characodon lateralis TaxID=208331 RepID=A0ABU7D106_9TELE|nr:hypothetical protein [Characodon lateralis]
MRVQCMCVCLRRRECVEINTTRVFPAEISVSVNNCGFMEETKCTSFNQTRCENFDRWEGRPVAGRDFRWLGLPVT